MNHLTEVALSISIILCALILLCYVSYYILLGGSYFYFKAKTLKVKAELEAKKLDLIEARMTEKEKRVEEEDLQRKLKADAGMKWYVQKGTNAAPVEAFEWRNGLHCLFKDAFPLGGGNASFNRGNSVVIARPGDMVIVGHSKMLPMSREDFFKLYELKK
jgi:hypothetical protein